MGYHQQVEFRSDTFTKPTPGMLAAMFEAEVGDDVYGEDPTVNKLESYVATLLGKEAALFVPSGTMGNQIAINLATHPGDSVLCEELSHVLLYEAGAGAVLSGIQYETIPWAAQFSDAAIAERFKPEDLHYSTSRLLLVENTHNRNAGRVLNVSEMTRIAMKGHALGLKTHCDGARIWNAAVATKQSEKDLLALFDSVSVCFSKGLGAPVGSALCASKATIDRARKVRKRWGGAMRQAGYLAAAALYALQHHRERLADDHQRASILANHLRELLPEDRGFVDYPNPGTNIVYFGVKAAAGDELVHKLSDEGVRVSHMGSGKIRAVTHLGVTDADLDFTLSVLSRVLAR